MEIAVMGLNRKITFIDIDKLHAEAESVDVILNQFAHEFNVHNFDQNAEIDNFFTELERRYNDLGKKHDAKTLMSIAAGYKIEIDEIDESDYEQDSSIEHFGVLSETDII